MNICIISGSARFNNNTIRVGKAIERLHPNDRVTLIDFQQYDIPLIAMGNLDPDKLSPFQQQLVNAMEQSQVVYVITPEYNWSTTPEILNWLHRMGERVFKAQFDQKVFAMVGVSTGKGGKAPALHLTGVFNKIISYLNLDSFVSAKIFEAHDTKEVLDESGRSKGNAEFDKGLQSFVDFTRRMSLRWNH